MVWYFIEAGKGYKAVKKEINLKKFRKSLNAWHRKAMC